MISMEEVRIWAELLRPAKQVLFLLDACFSGLAGIQSKSDYHNRTLERLAAYDDLSYNSRDWGARKPSLELSGTVASSLVFSYTPLLEGPISESEFEKDGVVSLAELMEYVG